MFNAGVIINLDEGTYYILESPPRDLSSAKNVSFVNLPNIGGHSRESFFAGFDEKQQNLKITLIKKDDLGVSNAIAWFEALTEPSPGIVGIANSFMGNANYPPPKIMYCWGTGSFVPQIWTTESSTIRPTEFNPGILGIPWRAEVDLSLKLDETTAFYKANQIAKKAQRIFASVESTIRAMNRAKGYKRVERGILQRKS